MTADDTPDEPCGKDADGHMIGRESVVRGLKAMNKAVDWDSKDAPKLYTESIWNENDRGVIILNGSALEDLLERKIRGTMPHLNAEETTYLFGFNGPIGTFSSKIRIANALGIINRQFYKKIDLVREMRNTCAHSPRPVSFRAEPIYNATVCLVHDLRMALPDKDDNSAIRNTFMVGCVLIMMTVQTGSADLAHGAIVEVMKRHSKPSPDIPGE